MAAEYPAEGQHTRGDGPVAVLVMQRLRSTTVFFARVDRASIGGCASLRTKCLRFAGGVLATPSFDCPVALRPC